MSDFEYAVAWVMINEGGLKEDNGRDPGGITNHGISLRFLRNVAPERLKSYGIFGDPDAQTIRDLTAGQAVRIYRGEWWDCYPFDRIREQGIATYVFDFGVNSGMVQAVKCLQRSLWAVFPLCRDKVLDDGILGPITLHFVNTFGDALLPAYRAERSHFYHLLAERHPQFKEDIAGWLNRAYKGLP